MPRSSESMAALAAALAKAQTELVNPEKSLTATIRGVRAGEGDRSFRYAPLSSGLDTVRKTLGKHEIATMQTTAIDQPSGMVQLTTTLAHSSGEWIASDWPVCPVAELANPQRMGLALTYARRYALFTLAGIAGEDDLDAPDLCAGPDSLPGSESGTSLRSGGRPPHQLPGSGNGRGRGRVKREPQAILEPAQSADLRDKLLAEIGALTSADLTKTWARQALAAKNRLNESDATLVEAAFERRLSELPSSDMTVASGPESRMPAEDGRSRTDTSQADGDHATAIDKSVLTISAPRRYRNREHLRYVMRQPCLICGRKPSDAHHLRYMQPRALGRKASDEFAVPLCRVHHREAHRTADERAWWKAAGIDPAKTARKLWKQTRVNEGRMPAAAPAEPPVSAERMGAPTSSTGAELG
jgi:hypothetical protein